MKGASEETRIRHLYRTLVLRGRVRLSFDAARRLVGPDCAFHLYASVPVGNRRMRTLRRHRNHAIDP